MSNKLKEARLKNSKSLREFCREAGFDILRLSKLERNHAVPTDEELEVINSLLCSELSQDDFHVDVESVKKQEATMISIEMCAELSKNRSSGEIECPLCGGSFHFVKHPNGHLWGKCFTDKCIGWMQ